jgi:hypothetical protein
VVVLVVVAAVVVVVVTKKKNSNSFKVNYSHQNKLSNNVGMLRLDNPGLQYQGNP